MELRDQRLTSVLDDLLCMQNDLSMLGVNQTHDDESRRVFKWVTDSMHARNGSLSLEHELGTIVEMIVPEFSDSCCIDYFASSGCTRRFAAYGSDDLLLATPIRSLTLELDPSRRFKVALADGVKFLGVIEFTRSPDHRSFSSVERLGASVFASRISANITNVLSSL
ncbi:hypothetical protein Pla52o_12890 [Novipirellula galeiformis]|uniref:GAF domain-containing protein n=2 Tax=Novipirellula galeiformis TaxID=2528004 RepID=A0A5C6CKP6_9BACT|nr:hypothetical protein Pla52o_12890 [Novipirellula galeiformis]